MTPEEREASPAYVGVCEMCGACRSCIVVAPGHPDPKGEWKREVAKFCAETIRGGLRLEHKTVGETRAMNWDCAKETEDGCPLRPRKKQKRAAKQETLAL